MGVFHLLAEREFLMSRSSRGSRNIKPRTTVLVLCCGYSEMEYFKDFREYFAAERRTVNITVKRCCGDPGGTGEAVDSHKLGMAYDKIFCVLDKDTFPEENIAELKRKEDEVIKVILQIPAFEVWGCIHYEYSTAQNSAAEWCSQLKRHISDYAKGESIFKKTIPKLSTAIANSKRLDKYHQCTPGTQNNPSTQIPQVFDYLSAIAGK